MFFCTLTIAVSATRDSFDVKHMRPNSLLIVFISSLMISLPYTLIVIDHLYPAAEFNLVFFNSSNENSSIDKIGGIYLKKFLNQIDY